MIKGVDNKGARYTQQMDLCPPHPLCPAAQLFGPHSRPRPSTGMVARNDGASTDKVPRAKEEVGYNALQHAQQNRVQSSI